VRAISFQILYDLAVKDVDEAFKAIVAADARRKKAEEQLIRLQQYQYDYKRRLQQSMSEGVLSSQAQNDQKFISTMEDAIQQQSNVLGQTQKQVATERERWMVARRKVASMEALLKRDQKRQTLVAAKQEQKANDEYAARAYRRLHAA